MKFNWGHGISIFIALFMIAVMSAVYYTSIQSIELVTPDYYQQEIEYQNVIDAGNNSIFLLDSIDVSINSDFVEISFAPSLNINQAQGNVTFYRPNNLKLDKNFVLGDVQDNNIIRIFKGELVSGKYELSIKWKNDNIDYIWEKSISL